MVDINVLDRDALCQTASTLNIEVLTWAKVVANLEQNPLTSHISRIGESAITSRHMVIREKNLKSIN